MEFEAVVKGRSYRFSFLNNTSVLVSGNQGDYILYKSKIWKCADEISSDIIEELGAIIDGQIKGCVAGS